MILPVRCLSLLVCVMMAGSVPAQELQTIPEPVIETTYLPQYFFSLDFAMVEPRLKGSPTEGGVSFSPKLDWTISPRFEFGLVNRGPWNPYVGYKGIYSDSNDTFYEPMLDTFFTFSRSTELHAIDFGVLSEPFSLLSVIQAQWDLTARLTVTDFQDRFGLDFDANGPSYIVARLRQQFVGAGPRAGMRLMLPFRDTGLALNGQFDAGIQWGNYRASYQDESFIDGEYAADSFKDSKGGILWHAGGQLALSYTPPRYCGRLSFSAGYLYEAWFSKDLGLMEGSDFGRFDYHGPFFRMEWKY